MSAARPELPASEETIDVRYPGERIPVRVTSYSPPPTFVFSHGGNNVMATPCNREFARGFAQHSGMLGIDRMTHGNGTPLYNAILRNEPYIQHIGGRSVGSVHALGVLLAPPAAANQITHLVLVSYPFDHGGGSGKNYEGSVSQRLRSIPAHVKILFILGDEDRFGRQNRDGKSLDNSYAFIDRILSGHDVWKICVRHSSHGSTTPPAFGGDAARDAMMRTVGEATAIWLEYESKKNRKETREAGVWYDLESREAFWSGWKKTWNMTTAREQGI